MADVIKTKSTLSIVAEFADGDDRTFNLDNPVNGLTGAAINGCASYAAACLVGDKDKASFTRFKSAKTVTSTITYLDLTTA